MHAILAQGAPKSLNEGFNQAQQSHRVRLVKVTLPISHERSTFELAAFRLQSNYRCTPTE